MKQWIPFIATMVAILALWWNISTTMATKEDIRKLNEDIRILKSEINSRLDRIEQNHLEHITRLHVQTKQNNSQ